MNVFRTALSQRSDTADSDTERALAKRVFEKIASLAPNSVYVFSLAELDDDVYHWQAYGDKGHGYCLGFRLEDIEKAYRPYAFFGRVQYDANLQHKWAEEFCAEMLSWRAAELTGTELDKYMDYVAADIELLLPTFKNAHFRCEKEYRLTVVMDGALSILRQQSNSPTCDAKVNVRLNRGKAISYYELRDDGNNFARTWPPLASIRMGSNL